MSRDHTEIIYTHNVNDWIDQHMRQIDIDRESWKSETVQAALYAKEKLLSDLSSFVHELEFTVAKDSIVKSEPDAY